MTMFVFALVIGALVVVSVIAFPFVGLALLPVFVIAFLAVVGWGSVFARRGPRALPERTTSTSEPDLDER